MQQSFVEWEERYSVGIASIDNQHKKLVDFTNALFEGCRQGQEFAADSFKSTLKDVVLYVKEHFQTEEKLFEQFAYPDTDAHRKQHQAFVYKVLEEVANFENNQKFVPNKFVRFLRDWLLEHIAVSDQAYSEFLKSKGVK